jgi:hypothetical protein
MKPSLQPSRTPSKLSDSLRQQLNMYALAATAAGVGLLALAQLAEAKIIYTKTHHVIDDHNRYYYLDLNHDGKADFRRTQPTAAAVPVFGDFRPAGPSPAGPVRPRPPTELWATVPPVAGISLQH